MEWVETFDNCVQFRCDNAAIYAVTLDDGLPPHVIGNLSVTPTPSSAPAGAARVNLANVPPEVLLQPEQPSTPVNQTPVNQTPVNQTPVNQTAATSAPVNQTPVNQTPVNQTPVNQTGSFAELTQAISALGSISLSSVPLLRDGGWAAILDNDTRSRASRSRTSR